ncbi:phage tail protein [uncultured Cloacibacillus sp.]|uniref:phage tail protein n=1 Tax=uncultured Cloacibacillus sp. TaxID=889794 RepID=UPI0025894938|nr:phage tail protein [uncultured Cloacibacillus sp.]
MALSTFTWEPDFAWQLTCSRRVNITTFETGKEQRSDLGAVPREWLLSFTDSESVISEIEAFWEARRGPVESFLWTPPKAAAAIEVRFKKDNFKSARSGLKLGSIELTLREVF